MERHEDKLVTRVELILKARKCSRLNNKNLVQAIGNLGDVASENCPSYTIIHRNLRAYFDASATLKKHITWFYFRVMTEVTNGQWT